ncbi:hypothetical protein L6452_16765 [Arctium lappa]|uniref:Uncharacterized protein n=1 Tax=Arctium lappa TaxID=4217 RepID=A0ACB9C1P4_ARCLA|nr:hypothetical protein L6452_16765 [Arctium lappa]
MNSMRARLVFRKLRTEGREAGVDGGDFLGIFGAEEKSLWWKFECYFVNKFWTYKRLKVKTDIPEKSYQKPVKVQWKRS